MIGVRYIQQNLNVNINNERKDERKMKCILLHTAEFDNTMIFDKGPIANDNEIYNSRVFLFKKRYFMFTKRKTTFYRTVSCKSCSGPNPYINEKLLQSCFMKRLFYNFGEKILN